MHAKNFATTHSQFAVQAEIESIAKGKTKKAWQKAGERGQNRYGRVGMLICVCTLLLCLIGTGIYVIHKFHAQQTGNFFGESAARKCHQGQKSRQTATKVGDLIAYNKYNCLSNKKLHINMQAQRKESVVQREVFRQKASDCKQKSRKPSKVRGANQNDNHLAFKTNGKSKGLITPATEHNNKCNKRCQKIRRLVKKFRQRRQENLGIKSENSRNSQVQQNNEEQPNGARPSIEELLNIDSTSESSSDEFGGNLSAGVHTNGRRTTKTLNGRDVRMDERPNENPISKSSNAMTDERPNESQN